MASTFIDLPLSESTFGTVTSVGLAAPAIFTVSGSPVTTSGTLTLTLATETANTVFAGPTSGGAAQPTFRALVAADVPSLPYVSSTLTNAHILVGNVSNIATDVAVSGEAILANTGALTLSNAAVIAKVLTGFVSGAGTVSASDSILTAIQKLDGNVANSATMTVLNKSANYTVTTTDFANSSLILCDSSGGAFNLTLPSPTTLSGKRINIKDKLGTFSSNNVTLVRASSEKIENVTASKILQSNFGSTVITTDGTDWYII